jgi:hypothetical protein
MVLMQIHYVPKFDSRASKEAKQVSRDCVDPQIIKTRLNKLQRYVFKFVNLLVVIYICILFSYTVSK